MKSGPLAGAHRCRDWIVVFGWPVRRCGLCGEVPVTVGFVEEDEP